ncbi:MAG TPA: HipA N-terminal domain-containing protein [Kiritimatiellia bacterium]|jgi:serine/threonine-protein kinase HipA|nr:HipA N-terminal domain-containing protein [Kiritimatiellia bacterium]
MRKAAIYRNGVFAGVLTEQEDRKRYDFRYDDTYYADETLPPISLTLPKTQQEHQCGHLFPFFANMLSEGANRDVQSRYLKIDERDDFGILLATAQTDTIGAVTAKPIEE